ncbi:polyprenyl synthetase family protein [Desulfuromonas sp. DDH964]|uniref:polyprenyl synthetase family protein n=1 Tax=Desulfuromonas sp. DDH964 TaxID=1823759 RepID=UPI00078B29DF|nr:polyprenyl synthetase family protein [Desulfuromonas sp. DDH964]AMV72706.1 octaprenyl diphosphate synthase [Desulfuromonas sp. DDH964]
MDKVLAQLKDDLQRVEAQFKIDLTSDVVLIRKVGEYVLASGGKRIRPILLLLCARLAGYRGDAHIGLASVVEFIHTATLLHDDVVDSAVLRRGNASANSVWGNEASVLVGDFLFAKSFSLMVRGGSLAVLQALSDATTQMAEGEVQQLISTCDLDIDEASYLNVIENKTAILISAACRVGGILGNLEPQQEEALAAYGMDLGIAFQLMDDALDYVADQDEFGKAKGHDLAEGKMTLPLIHALRQCTPAERQEVAVIVEAEDLDDVALTRVTALIERYQGIEYTRRRAADMVARAKSHLAAFASGQERDALETVADYVLSRRK